MHIISTMNLVSGNVRQTDGQWIERAIQKRGKEGSSLLVVLSLVVRRCNLGKAFCVELEEAAGFVYFQSDMSTNEGTVESGDV